MQHVQFYLFQTGAIIKGRKNTSLNQFKLKIRNQRKIKTTLPIKNDVTLLFPQNFSGWLIFQWMLLNRIVSFLSGAAHRRQCQFRFPACGKSELVLSAKNLVPCFPHPSREIKRLFVSCIPGGDWAVYNGGGRVTDGLSVQLTGTRHHQQNDGLRQPNLILW